MSLIINFMGGPSTGKSTLAAGLFYELKLNGYNVELVREFAKDLAYDQDKKTIKNQAYVTGTQIQRQMQPYGQVDVVITDSPILLGVFYNPKPRKAWNNFILELFNEFDNYNILLNRNPNNKFENENRLHDLEKSIEVDNAIVEFLKEYEVDYNPVLVEHRKTLETIYPMIEEELKKRSITHY